MNKDEKLVASIIGWAVVAVLAIILFLMSVVVTKPNEYRVVKQFGSIVRVEKEPGLSFKVPFIQSVSSVEKCMLFYDIASSDVITSDKKTMVVDAYVMWRITDPEAYMKALGGNRATAESRIDMTVYNAIKNTISGMTQNEVILSRDGQVTVSAVAEDTEVLDVEIDETTETVKIQSLTEHIAENLATNTDYGVELLLVEVKVLDLPNDNKTAVYNRMISERNNVAAAYTASGDAEAQKIRNTTDKEISIMKAEAEAKAEATIAEGEAEYMRLLSEAYNDEAKAEFYDFVRQLDTLKAGIKDGTLVLDPSSPLAEIFYVK